MSGEWLNGCSAPTTHHSPLTTHSSLIMSYMEERLHKILAHAGVGSRRKCEELMAAGRVSVDGQAVRELGTKIDADAHDISVDGEPIHTERSVYWLVNKPRGYLCTNHDPARRPWRLTSCRRLASAFTPSAGWMKPAKDSCF